MVNNNTYKDKFQFQQINKLRIIFNQSTIFTNSKN